MVSELNSVHSNQKEDRKWEVICQSIAYPYYASSMGLSVWSFYVNDWDSPMDFQCQQDNVITGMGSFHDNGHEGRRYKFRCTYVTHWTRSNCFWSSYTAFDAAVNQDTQSGKFLVGLEVSTTIRKSKSEFYLTKNYYFSFFLFSDYLFW